MTSDPESPFARAPKRIFHGAYHKMGTTWITRILMRVAREFAMVVQKSNENGDVPNDNAQIIIANHSQMDLAELGDFVGSHLIRDPRDVIVSGYFYHLWTDEAWARQPRLEFGGLSYQQQLNSIGRHEGLAAEILRFSEYISSYRLREWNYADSRILEIKYEELFAEPESGFERLFRHYGFKEDAVARSCEFATQLSFDRLASRKTTGVQSNRHMRSGIPGEWRKHLNGEHCNLIKSSFGDLLVAMGYAANNDW